MPQDARCLLRCESGVCTGNPYLAFELPLPSGLFGFGIEGPADPPDTRYTTYTWVYQW